MSTFKDKLIADFFNEPLKIGDDIQIMGLGIQNKAQWGNIEKVVDIIDGFPYFNRRGGKEKVVVEWRKWEGNVGVNPFPKNNDRISDINFQLESIIHQLFREDKYDIDGTSIASVNFNPFVFVNGEKQFYQRPLVWNIEDKQLLIESIYNNVDCGKILVRNRGWDELRKLQKDGHELAWKDVVDGKQRINTVWEFMNDGFTDVNGNYYSDFSKMAQHKFTDHQLFSYSELSENTLDDVVLRQFLRLNFTGVAQSKEHIEFVKSLTYSQN